MMMVLIINTQFKITETSFSFFLKLKRSKSKFSFQIEKKYLVTRKTFILFLNLLSKDAILNKQGYYKLSQQCLAIILNDIKIINEHVFIYPSCCSNTIFLRLSTLIRVALPETCIKEKF